MSEMTERRIVKQGNTWKCNLCIKLRFKNLTYIVNILRGVLSYTSIRSLGTDLNIRDKNVFFPYQM